MKRILLIFSSLVFSLSAIAQTVPRGINYQGIALAKANDPADTVGNPGLNYGQSPVDLNAVVDITFTFSNDSLGTTLLYEEVHTDIYHDVYGHFDLRIGRGTPTGSYDWWDIDWAEHVYLQVRMQVDGNDPYVISNSLAEDIFEPLLTIPYAYMAQTAMDVDDADADPINELQELSLGHDTLFLSNNGGFVVLPQFFDGNYNSLTNTPNLPDSTSELVNDAGYLLTELDGSITNELQMLSISNDTIYLSDGGFVKIPAGFNGDYNSLINTPYIPFKLSDLFNDLGFISVEQDSSVTNELQTLSYMNDTLFLSNGGYVVLPQDQVNDADADSTNEIQMLSMVNDTIFLSNGGYVVLPQDQVNDADADSTNEIQMLSLVNDTIFLSNGGYVVLPQDQVNDADADSTNEIQMLSMVNDTIFLSNGGYVVLPQDQVNDADADSTNEIQMLSMVSDTLFLSNGGYVVLPQDQVNDADADSTNEIQMLSMVNDTIFLSNGGYVVLPQDQVNDADADATNELQILSIAGDTIYLSNGGSVVLPAGFDGDYNSLINKPSIPTRLSQLTNDRNFLSVEQDGSSTNEIQFLDIVQDTLKISQGGWVLLTDYFDKDYSSINNTPTALSTFINDAGYLTAEVDGDVTNEIQNLSLSANKDTIKLSDGGSVTLTDYFDKDYNSLNNTPTDVSEFNNDAGYLTTEVDGDVTNEIQSITLKQDTLTLSNGGGQVWLGQDLTKTSRSIKWTYDTPAAPDTNVIYYNNKFDKFQVYIQQIATDSSEFWTGQTGQVVSNTLTTAAGNTSLATFKVIKTHFLENWQMNGTDAELTVYQDDDNDLSNGYTAKLYTGVHDALGLFDMNQVLYNGYYYHFELRATSANVSITKIGGLETLTNLKNYYSNSSLDGTNGAFIRSFFHLREVEYNWKDM